MPGRKGRDDFAAAAQRLLAAARDFPAYSGAKVPRREQFERETMALIEAVVRAGSSSRAAGELLDQVLAHLGLDMTADRLFDGVSAAREDRDRGWEERAGAIFARSKDAGAVHLELGTWSAWPAERQRAVADEDGLAEVIRLDFDPRYELDVVADAQVLPFAEGSIDRIRADSVLEHLAYPHHVIRECLRVLRPGGAMLLATPWVFNLHGYPDDYLRYSPSFYERACREAGFAAAETDIEAARGVYYTLHNSAKAAIVSSEHAGAPAMRLLHLLTIEWLAALVPFDEHFNGGGRQWFHSVQVIAVKPGDYVPSGRPREWERPFVERTLDLLADPLSKRPLRLEGDRLVCPPSRMRYPVYDDVPYFTVPFRARRPRMPPALEAAVDRGRDALAVARGRRTWSVPVQPS
jgi:SAM-dependent methyltransferase